jgi:hypothetical protein
MFRETDGMAATMVAAMPDDRGLPTQAFAGQVSTCHELLTCRGSPTYFSREWLQSATLANRKAE